MKKQTKQLLALLLAICSLVTFAVPTVFATGESVDNGAQTPANLEVDFAEGFQNAGVTQLHSTNYVLDTAKAALLDEQYAQGNNQWKLYSNDGAYVYISGRSPKCNASTQVLWVSGQADAPFYFPVEFKAPGTGDYALSVDCSTWGSTMTEGGAYIVEVPENGFTKETLPKEDSAKAKALVEITDNGEVTSQTNVSLVEGKTYVLVFYGVGTANGAYFQVSDFALTYKGETVNVEPSEPGEPGEPVEPSVFTFAGYAEDGVELNNITAEIKAAYEDENNPQNWRFEAASHLGQFAAGKFNEYSGGKLQLYGAKNWWYAFRLQSPGEGKFDLNFTIAKSSSGTTANIYFLKAAAVDEALGEDAAEYAQIMNENPSASGSTEAYSTYKSVIAAQIAEAEAAMTVDFTTGAAATGTFRFEEDTDYVMVIQFTMDGSKRALLNTLTMTYAEDQSEEEPEPEEPEEPEVPVGPGYTDGKYDFYQGNVAAENLADGIDNLAAMYEAGTLNWKYEAFGGNLVLSKAKYSAKTKSMQVTAATDWWLAFRIKAPAEDGTYDIKMTHGAGGNGAEAGSIFVIPGNTSTNEIFKVASKQGATMTTNWFYGEKTTDSIGGRETTTGSVALKAGEEYIVVFLPTVKSPLSNSAYFWLGQLEVTRTGEYVEPEIGGEDSDTVFYEFYDWNNPGQYLYHYKSEEDLGKKILAPQIAQEYADGTRNWCHVTSNGFATFSTGTPYLNTTVGESQYFVLKIKSPGTGTYKITYNHMAVKNANSALRGSVYIMPVVEGVEYASIRDEADFLDAVLSTTYSADKTAAQSVVGEYTAFEEGKEYYLCFSVEDDNTAKKSSLRLYPQSMTMERTGDFVAVGAADADYGIVYKFFQEKYANKWMTTREADEYVMNTIAWNYDNGYSNWKLESYSGSAKYTARYLRAGVSKAGGAFAFRIKSPGTGTYRVTLKSMLGPDVNAASQCELHIIEAPETTIPGGDITSYMVNEPVTEFSSSTSGSRYKKVSNSGTYGFQEGKEYIVIVYGKDDSDSRNTSNSTYMYIDRLVMQWVGEYVETEKVQNEGGIIAEDVITEFKVGASMITTINDHDYLVMAIYGGTMMIYDLDEWRLVDEIATGISTPCALEIDGDGNWWLLGTASNMFCYNPFTRETSKSTKIHSGSRGFDLCYDETNGMIYICASSTRGVYVNQYDPKTDTLVNSWMPSTWAKYPGANMELIGDYLYLAVSGENRYEVWKLDKRTGKVVATTDITDRMGENRYVNNLSKLDDEHLLIATVQHVTVVDITTMELLSQEEIGLRGKVSRVTSGVLDGKNYFVSDIEGVCYYDLETKEFGAMGGALATAKTGFRPQALATIDDSRLPGTSIITFGGMSADGLNLYAVNVKDNVNVTLIGLVEPGFGVGVDAHTIFKGEPGTSQILYGPMYPDFPARVYDTETGELLYEFKTNGQLDSVVWYKGTMYAGNYSSAILTQMKGNEPVALFRLNDENFNQSRIHGLCAGDDKVFVGTVPDNFNKGGVIAWYDLETELTYVVTGPNPEDVYYAKCSKVTVTNEWYSAVTGELVNMEEEWDKDQDGDGVCQYFKGPIPMQSIIGLTYSDGLLYGTSTLRAGTGDSVLTGDTAKLFIYDVENMKMLKVIDLADYLPGLPSSIHYIQSLNADPDISNKVWGVVSETLFSVTYNRETNKVDIKNELSFRINYVNNTTSIGQEIYFEGDWMYVLFGARGGICKVNRNNPSEYVKLLGDFTRTNQVPAHFVVAEDGNLYYISKSEPHIYVVDTDVTEDDLAAAQAVTDAINLIPEEVTLADREIIFAARDAWEAMIPGMQPYVTNYDKLEDAEVRLLQLRVEALSDDITIEDEAELVSIRQTYTSLELEQRMQIDFKKVSDAESIMSILRGERTTNLIASIGEVTLADEQAIRDARASFMALSVYERRLVTNESVLNAAEAKLTSLLLKKNEAGAVDKRIAEIGFVFFGDGAKISGARQAYDKLDDQAKGWVESYGTLVAAEIILVIEYILAVAIVAGGVLLAIPATREKILKKKTKAE